MGCLSGLARLLLVVINIVFALVGLALTIVGFILRYGESIYGPILDKGKTLLKTVLDDTNLDSFNVDEVDLGELLHSMALGIIIGGLALLILSFLGCCGACYKLEILLWLYAIVIIVFVIAEAVGLGLLYGKPDLVKDNVKRSVKEYKGLGSSEVTSVGWNIIMIQFKCCGVESYRDFEEAPNWDKSPGTSGVTLVTPIACCKTLPTGSSAGALTCATTFDVTTSNGETGCYDTLWKESFANTRLVVPILVVCGIIQFAFIFFAIFIAKSDKNGVSPI